MSVILKYAEDATVVGLISDGHERAAVENCLAGAQKIT